MSGNDDIQGLKHGFLAGNMVYYKGWKNMLFENEALALTHLFFHDLRSHIAGSDNYYPRWESKQVALELENEFIENRDLLNLGRLV